MIPRDILRLLVCVVVLLAAPFRGQVVLVSAAAPDEDDGTNYVNELLHDLDKNLPSVDSQLAEGEVKRRWGVPDTNAVAGKVFNFPIPSDAFAGNVEKFEVTEAGESSLPPWLQFDELSKTFVGVPLDKDVGQYFIAIKAIGQSKGKLSSAKDVFSIEVVEDTPEYRWPEMEKMAMKCLSGESQTVASVIIDADLSDLNTTVRTDLLNLMSSFLKIPLKMLKFVPPKTEGTNFDGSAVLAGPGNAKKQLTSGSVMQWQVGCSMNILQEYKEHLNVLEKAAEDGSLANRLGYPIIGWQVTSVFPRISRRDKRQIGGAYGTPVPGVVPTHWPRYTERVDEMEPTDDTLTPESRIVPTMASPVFTQPSHRHRHNHGEWQRGHQRLIESIQATVSPVLHHHRLPTSPTPFGATPVVVPSLPTKYVPLSSADGLMPSRLYPEESTPIDVLVSSMITPSFGQIDVVPTHTIASSPQVTTSEIKPTRTQTDGEKTKKPSGTPNFKPTIEKRMPKLSMVAGKVWKQQIPRDTFVDMEDGDTRHLKLLFLTSERTSIQPTSWIQFDPEKQMLYALPLDEHIGKYEYILEAMDSEAASTHDCLEIYVRQHQAARTRHHEFSITLKYDKWRYPIFIDWNIEMTKKLADFYGDKNENMIAVQSVSADPVIFTWANDSLPPYPCPAEEISYLMNRMVDSNGKVSKAFKKVMASDFQIQDVSYTYLGVCHSPGSSTSSPLSNFAPMLRNPIERINTTVGEILRFKVPDDTFYDFEDGSTRYLTLTFLTIENVQPPKSSWVQFNPKSQELYGLPFEGDVKKHEFQLVAMDSNGQHINDVFVIEVHPRPPKKWSVEFSLHIDHDYEEFSRDISKKVLVAWKLAKLFDDPDPRYITVGSISKGSVVYAWTNNTLPHDPCPHQTISKLVKNIFNENETLSSKLTEAMQPEFKILKADAMPLGICLGEVTPTSVTIPPPPATEKAAPAPVSDDDIYITTIIPAVVIAVMLIIAAMVACFLYRKKRKGKMTMQDHNTFIGNRAPVIFGDEMEDKPDPAKPPVIMKEEKPPLAPPDYLRSSASSRDSTPQLDRMEQANARNTNADLHTDPSPPYQPPPPFTTNRDSKNARPKTTPTYRQPPPYMPPVPP